MVTAGPKTGFGLIPLDGGIGFYNSQSMFFITLIHDFQQRMAQDPQGQKATQLYYFTATSGRSTCPAMIPRRSATS
jgi:hypothetical protein